MMTYLYNEFDRTESDIRVDMYHVSTWVGENTGGPGPGPGPGPGHKLQVNIGKYKNGFII